MKMIVDPYDDGLRQNDVQVDQYTIAHQFCLLVIIYVDRVPSTLVLYRRTNIPRAVLA
jgi:hypothetical protein